MPMDPGMIFGMYLIIAGVGVAAYGLLPSKAAQTAQANRRSPCSRRRTRRSAARTGR